MSRPTDEDFYQQTAGNPPQGRDSQVDGQPDDQYFAEERERQDPKAGELDKIDDTDDLDTDTLGPDAARNLGGGKGDFRQYQDTDDQ